MAKIFSNISKTAETLSEKYNNSSVNNEFTTFKALRNSVSGDLVPSQLLVTNRPKKVYDTYTDPRLTSLPIVQEYRESQLIEKSIVTRVRRSGFYDAFRNASANQTITNQARNNTFVEIKPYTTEGANEAYSVETSRMLENSQALPLVSGPRDIRRMNRLLASNQGLRFKASQQILQAGNTFGQTRAYNPLSIETMVLNYSNATLFNPLERVPRLVESNAIRNQELRGRLQKETVITLQSKLSSKFVGGSTPQGNGISGIFSSFLGSKVTNVANNTSFNVFGTTINIGQAGRALDTIRAAAEALRSAINVNDATLQKDQTAYDALYQQDLWPLLKNTDGTIDNFENRKKAYLQRAKFAITNARKATNINSPPDSYLKDYPDDDYRSSADYTETLRSQLNSGSPKRSALVSARYMKDSFNLTSEELPIRTIADLKNSSDANTSKDYITFKVAVPGVPELANGIKFRAFISDFNHSAKGDYEEVRYVGRPERFMTYKGMNRSATFSLYLVAFSEQELSGIWARCDMLNKLVFPVKNEAGFMMPPLTVLTVGNVLVNQPGYVQNVDMKLNDIPWDIDNELPMAVQLTISFNIIEDAYITQQSDSKNLFTYAAIQNFRDINVPNINIPEPNLNSILDIPPPSFTAQPVAPLIEQRAQEQQSAANRAFRRQTDIINTRAGQA